MVRALLWVVRQRRYQALTAILWTVAVACVGAGTFELHRFQEKRHDNGVLRANAHAAPIALSASLVPLTNRTTDRTGPTGTTSTAPSAPPAPTT